MDQQRIDELKALRHSYHFVLPRQHEAEKKAVRDRMAALDAACDHRYPDGSSAIESYQFMRSCQICNWDDL